MQGLCKGYARAVHAAFSVEGAATGPVPSELHWTSFIFNHWTGSQTAKCPRHQQQKTAKPCPPQRCHCKGSAICKHCIVHWALVMDCPSEATSQGLEMNRNSMGCLTCLSNKQCSSMIFSPSHGDATNPDGLMNIPRLNSIVCLGIWIILKLLSQWLRPVFRWLSARHSHPRDSRGVSSLDVENLRPLMVEHGDSPP